MAIRTAPVVYAAVLMGWPVLQSGAGAMDLVPLVRFEKVCAHEKSKKLVLEGYFDLQKMQCRGSRNKRTNKVINGECSLAIYAGAKPGGTRITGWIPVADDDRTSNKMLWPPEKNYMLEDIKIHDSAGKTFSFRRKLRLTGNLRKTADCQMSIEKIDVVK